MLSPGLKIRLKRKGDVNALSITESNTIGHEEGVGGIENGGVSRFELLGNASATGSYKEKESDISGKIGKEAIVSATLETPREVNGQKRQVDLLKHQTSLQHVPNMPGANTVVSPPKQMGTSKNILYTPTSVGMPVENSTPPFKEAKMDSDADGITHTSGKGTIPGKIPDLASLQEPLNRELYRIPGYAGWFSWSKVHSIERNAFKEFFEGRSPSKTPKIYKEYRDFIINKYRENPYRILTFTEVRKMLIGDVNCLRKVFDFLDQWGLINHHASSDGKHATQLEGVSPVISTGYLHNGMQMAFPAVPAPSMASTCKPAIAQGNSGVLQSSNLCSRGNMFQSATPAKSEAAAGSKVTSATKYSCNSCAKDCSSQRYHSAKTGSNLCINCFKDGKYANVKQGLLPSDFVYLHSDTGVPATEWTDQEALLLLEGISKFGENWSRVAQHVGTKSRNQCVTYFIQLPFGDQFLNEVDYENFNVIDAEKEVTPAKRQKKEDVTNKNSVDVLTSFQAEELEQDEESGTPFVDSTNPLFSQVAFMSSMVGPHVAAAAAQAALTALSEEDSSLDLSNCDLQLKDSYKDVKLETEPKIRADTEEDDQDVKDKVNGENDNASEKKKKDIVPTLAQVRAGMATALAAAAANAKHLADQEEQEIELCMSGLIENQFKKLQSKVDHFEELELLYEKERIQLEQMREQLFADHLRLAQYQLSTSQERLSDSRHN